VATPVRPPVGNPREQIMIIAKEVVIAVLRERGQHARADFVDRELPERIDSIQHGGLLATLHLDLADLAEAASR
jgi:hypothetical protein